MKQKKKVIKITESQFKKLIEDTINTQKDEILNEQDKPMAAMEGFTTTFAEEYPKREWERKESGFRRQDFDPYPRESNLESLFGPYAEDVPPQVYQYMRKNPQQVMSAFRDIYGDKY